jgi:hypothetical protein
MKKYLFSLVVGVLVSWALVDAGGAEAINETPTAGSCGFIGGAESCVPTYGTAEILPLTERKLLVLTASLSLQDCEPNVYASVCRASGYPDTDLLMTTSPAQCVELGPVLALKKYKAAAAKGWRDHVGWRCE